MKISNLFKKTSKTSISTIQKLEKKQLEKVIGGTDINTSRSNIKSPSGTDSSGDTGIPVGAGTSGTTEYVPTP